MARRETLETGNTSDPIARLSLAAGRLRTSAAAAAELARTLGEPVLAWTNLSIPDIDPLALFARSGPRADTRVVLLRPADGSGIAGVDAAWTFVCDGPDRFSRADAAWRTLAAGSAGVPGDEAHGPSWSRVPGAGGAHGANARGLRPRGPIALYGFAFEDTGSPWNGYPAGLVLVPRVAIHTAEDGTRLILAAIVEPDRRADDAVEATIACLYGCLHADALAAERDRERSAFAPHAAGAVAVEAEPLRIAREFPSAEVWKHAVADTAAAVRVGRFRKAVLARGVEIAGHAFDATAALATLRREYPGCTTFAVARGDRCFLGASPERLVRIDRGEVSLAALAGSAPRGGTGAADRELAAALLHSAKDRIEHAVVVDALRDALSGIAAEAPSGDGPRLLTVHNTHHLYTPLRARLREHHSVFEVIRRLHPTPAVGGLPRDAALDWIRRHEGWERGWYAGPVGWTCGTGDGEACVAIRCALLEPGRARLFAGCGIVADSDPEQELAESGWKLQPILSALSQSLLPDKPAPLARG